MVGSFAKDLQKIKKCTVVGFARHLGHLFKLVGLKEPTLSNEHNLNGFILALMFVLKKPHKIISCEVLPSEINIVWQVGLDKVG